MEKNVVSANRFSVQPLPQDSRAGRLAAGGSHGGRRRDDPVGAHVVRLDGEGFQDGIVTQNDDDLYCGVQPVELPEGGYLEVQVPPAVAQQASVACRGDCVGYDEVHRGREWLLVGRPGGKGISGVRLYGLQTLGRRNAAGVKEKESFL